VSVASTRLERNKRLRQNPIRRLASRRQDIVKPPYNPATDLDGLRTALLMLMSFGDEAIGHASPPAGDEFLDRFLESTKSLRTTSIATAWDCGKRATC